MMWETPNTSVDFCDGSFWGTPDASVDFCEDKYTELYWIGEYYNTLSSLLYICVGIPFLFTKLSNIAWCVIGIGVGSILLHGTLRWYGQWVDEIFMMATAFKTLKYIRPEIRNIYLLLSITLYIHFSHLYFVFLIIFCVLKVYLVYITFKSNTIFTKLYIYSFIIGLLCWILDQLACHWVKSLHLHAWWHVFTSIGVLFGLLELMNKDKYQVSI